MFEQQTWLDDCTYDSEPPIWFYKSSPDNEVFPHVHKQIATLHAASGARQQELASVQQELATLRVTHYDVLVNHNELQKKHGELNEKYQQLLRNEQELVDKLQSAEIKSIQRTNEVIKLKKTKDLHKTAQSSLDATLRVYLKLQNKAHVASLSPGAPQHIWKVKRE